MNHRIGAHEDVETHSHLPLTVLTSILLVLTVCGASESDRKGEEPPAVEIGSSAGVAGAELIQKRKLRETH